MELRVLLNDMDVGVIRAERGGRIEFAFAPGYLAAQRRPVLGQYFEDHLDEVQRSHTRLPPFFSNLLPEGGLRELLARRANVHLEREADLIAVLGEDLPGAIVVRRADTAADRAMASWPAKSLDPARLTLLREHVQRLPLLRDVG